MPSFSAALLAGGQSMRMGRDKALLPAPGSDLVLWQRQLAILEKLEPEEIFWSGPVRPGVPPHLVIVPDAVENAGPLAGISACLDRLRSDLLIVLAVDLPQMNAPFLKRLLASCTSERGAVASRDGLFEPLAAVYPKKIGALAADHLRQGRRALQDFILQAEKAGALLSVPLGQEEIPFFKNLNRPHDLDPEN